MLMENCSRRWEWDEGSAAGAFLFVDAGIRGQSPSRGRTVDLSTGINYFTTTDIEIQGYVNATTGQLRLLSSAGSTYRNAPALSGSFLYEPNPSGQAIDGY